MQTAFDSIAKNYDADFSQSEIGKLQRNIVWDYLDKKNITGKSILEINCGTGEDAKYLSEKGNQVTATDTSEEMLSATKNKLSECILSCEIFRWNLNEPFPLPDKKYDLIFSNFGGLNCISPERLNELSIEFSNLLHSNGQLIFVVMGRFCLWETCYFLLKGKFKTAFRRRSKKPLKAKLDKNTFVDTWYYSSDDLKKIFSPHFNYVIKRPVGIFIPPSYLENFFRSKKKALIVLSKIESNKFIQKYFTGIADHYLVELIKRL